MSPLLLATAALVVAGGLAAVALEDSRARMIGLAIALVFAPFATDPLLPEGALAACVLAGALASLIAWGVAVPDSPLAGPIGRLGRRSAAQERELPEAASRAVEPGPLPDRRVALSAVELTGPAGRAAERTPALGSLVRRLLLPEMRVALPLFGATAVVAFGAGILVSVSGAPEGGSGFGGPAADLAAGLALCVIAAPGLWLEQRPEHFGRSLLLFVVGAILLRTGLAGTPGTVEALAGAALIACLGGAVALIARRAAEPAADAHLELWSASEIARVTVAPAPTPRVAASTGFRAMRSALPVGRPLRPTAPGTTLPEPAATPDAATPDAAAPAESPATSIRSSGLTRRPALRQMRLLDAEAPLAPELELEPAPAPEAAAVSEPEPVIEVAPAPEAAAEPRRRSKRSTTAADATPTALKRKTKRVVAEPPPEPEPPAEPSAELDAEAEA